MSFVSKIYPRGTQLKNLSKVSNVEPTNAALAELSWNGPTVKQAHKSSYYVILTMTNWQSWKICENSEHMESFRCLALICVMFPEEKSNTSSESNFRMAMLFWHKLSLVLLAPTMSEMNDGQCLGHSRSRMSTRTMFNLLRYTFSLSASSLSDDVLIMSPTMYFLMPSHCSLGNVFHRVFITASKI